MIYCCQKHVLEAVENLIIPHIKTLKNTQRKCFFCDSGAKYALFVLNPLSKKERIDYKM